MNICTLLDMVAAGGTGATAIQDDTEKLTAAELRELSARGGAWLRAHGCASVLYVGESTADFAVALFASAWAGVPFVPLNYRLADEQLHELASRHPGAVALGEGRDRLGHLEDITAVAMAEWAAEPTGQTDEERWTDDEAAIALLLYTSGTSGTPKAVVLRHRHLTSYILGVAEFLSAEPSEASLVSVPTYHIAGVANLLTNLYAGRRIVYLARFTAEEWLERIASEDVTHAMVVPTMLARVVSSMESHATPTPRTLRSLSYGGAKTPRSVIERALRLLPDVAFVNAYGLTETSSTIALLGPQDHDAARSGDERALERLGSVGRILETIEVGVFDAGGTRLSSGQRGEIKVRGPQVSGEYSDRSALDDDGWFPTRDLGWVDDDGYLFVSGRSDDTIIRGGENIAPAEIESVLLEHPAVSDAGVVGIQDEVWGQAVAAAVVLGSPDVAPEALRLWAVERLRSSKAPSHVRIVAELPYSETGKLVRRNLVGLFEPTPPQLSQRRD